MRELICITCPKGCRLTVDETSEPFNVAGQGCKRGIAYAENEIKDPRRMVTTTVKVKGGNSSRVAVKTQTAIPKPLIFEAMEVLNNIELIAPIKSGQMVVKNLLGTEISVVTSANCN